LTTDRRSPAPSRALGAASGRRSSEIHQGTLFKGGPPEGVTGGSSWDLTPQGGAG